MAIDIPLQDLDCSPKMANKRLFERFHLWAENDDPDLWRRWQSLLRKTIHIMLRTSDNSELHTAHVGSAELFDDPLLLDYSLLDDLDESHLSDPVALSVEKSRSQRHVAITTNIYLEMENIEGSEYISEDDNATLQVHLVAPPGDACDDDFLLCPTTNISKFGEPFDGHIIPVPARGGDDDDKLVVNLGSSSFSSVSVLLELKHRVEKMSGLYLESFSHLCWWLHTVPPTILRWTLQGWSLFHSLLVSCGFGSAKEELMAEVWATPSPLLTKIIMFLHHIDPTSIQQRPVTLTAAAVELGITTQRHFTTGDHTETYVMNLVPCVACRGWPSFAREEFAHLAPPLVKMILRSGYYAVPSSSHSGHGWRLTFPRSTSLILEQVMRDKRRRECLRILYATVLHMNEGFDGAATGEVMLCYDHVATIFLWQYEAERAGMDWTEKSPPWTEADLQEQVIRFLETLQQHLNSKHLPHYFLPGFNMLRNFTDIYLSCITNQLTGILEKPRDYFPF